MNFYERNHNLLGVNDFIIKGGINIIMLDVYPYFLDIRDIK